MTNSIKGKEVVDSLCFSDYMPYWDKLRIESIRKGAAEVDGRANPSYRYPGQKSGMCVCNAFSSFFFSLRKEENEARIIDGEAFPIR